MCRGFGLVSCRRSGQRSRQMDGSAEISAVAVRVWLAEEGIVEVDPDFPVDGDLFTAGLDSMAVMQLVVAAEEKFGVVLGPEDLTRENLLTPGTLAALLEARK